MCGITGFWAPRAPASPEALLASMNSALRHRGPDGEGAWSAPPGIHLAHRRLAIIDLSPAGHQPMKSASGRFVITFNGEVYNFSELKAALTHEGHAPA